MESAPSPLDRASTIFAEACQLAPDARDAYLHETCGQDPSLRQLLEEMLQAHSQQEDFLAEPTLGNADPDSSIDICNEDTVTVTQGAQIGPYSLLERIGEGGFGSVYIAEQTK